MIPGRLTLYGRAYCHLCHDMEMELRQILAQAGVPLEVVDVDSDPSLEARFDELVPVLMYGELEISRYHLDHAAVHAILKEIR